MAKRRVGNWIDFRPLKVENYLDSLMCKWHATYRWKMILMRATTFLHASLQSKVCKRIYGLLKSREFHFREFWDFNLAVPGQNDIWVLAPWPSKENIIKGKVVVSPKSIPLWVFWVYVCLWLVHAPKVLQLRTNQLVVWFVQVHVSNWLACHSS
jgi:hypothetical protein